MHPAVAALPKRAPALAILAAMPARKRAGDSTEEEYRERSPRRAASDGDFIELECDDTSTMPSKVQRTQNKQDRSRAASLPRSAKSSSHYAKVAGAFKDSLEAMDSALPSTGNMRSDK